MASNCKYCNKEISGHSAGAHVTSCNKNPNRDKWRKSVSNGLKKNNPMFNKKHRDKLSKSINEKVKNGTWHNSFSKARTHEYKGMKFYGKWELGYAKWLDKNKIKWRQVKEKFYYEFEGKGHYYTPDFYLLDIQEYIEIKGYKTKKDEAKWKWFPKDLKLNQLFGEDLYKLGIIDSYKKI